MATLSEKLENAQSLSDTEPTKAIALLEEIVNSDVQSSDEENIRAKEQAILDLGSLYFKNKKATELADLIKFIRPFLKDVSKAKAAKLVRALVDNFLDMEANTGQEVGLCQECINWAKGESREYLRQSLESRLVALYYDTKQYIEALQLASTLLQELKKLDDKMLLVEVQLLESKVYYSLSNLGRARAALTSARTTANAIYCPPKLQAALDMQSGILHAADERDFKTAFSYFYEAFEGYDSIDSPKAIIALKYMLMCKIMLNSAEEVQSILSGKLALKYADIELEAMKSIAQASHKRSLADFKQTVAQYSQQLEKDPIVQSHLDSLYDSLLEQNLCRLIEPFSRVQVAHVAGLIKLPVETVEKKLSQMILDKKFSGILDQGSGVLMVFEEAMSDKSYTCALDIVQHMGQVVDSLYSKAKKLT